MFKVAWKTDGFQSWRHVVNVKMGKHCSESIHGQFVLRMATSGLVRLPIFWWSHRWTVEHIFAFYFYSQKQSNKKLKISSCFPFLSYCSIYCFQIHFFSDYHASYDSYCSYYASLLWFFLLLLFSIQSPSLHFSQVTHAMLHITDHHTLMTHFLIFSIVLLFSYDSSPSPFVILFPWWLIHFPLMTHSFPMITHAIPSMTHLSHMIGPLVVST